MNQFITEVVPAVRMILSDKLVPVAKYKAIDTQIDKTLFENVVFIDNDSSTESIISELQSKIQGKELPSFVVIKNSGFITIANNNKEAENLQSAFTAAISSKSPLKVERQKSTSRSLIEDKIAIITGGAQGFGGNIAQMMFEKGANVVIADINETVANELVASLNGKNRNNKAFFVKTDVSNEQSVQNLVNQTIIEFGGLDVFISNAGILRAGGLDEMSLDTFELMTKVNYSAYFICAKYASVPMKIQSKYRKDYFTDLIQINSKSGLKGSNKNFAYAGGKFGGIGLTQSFAMELMPYRIKVNSICPGNFFDGPLWADPEKGLFVQYLKAGKVPNAKTIEDVKHFYEKQVPAGRGCTAEDVMKAVLYIIDQEYETGQAVPVTGGQIMMS